MSQAQVGKENPRKSIPFFEGINSTVQHVISKVTELSHAENARSSIIGSIEKREGQTKFGTTANGSPFYAIENYGISKFENLGSNKGIYRISEAGVQDASTLTISIFEDVFVTEQFFTVEDIPLFPIEVKMNEYVTVSEPTIYSRVDNNTIILSGVSNGSSIYSLTPNEVWQELTDPDAQNIIGATADFARVDDTLIIVNGVDYNRELLDDGTTVIPSTAVGSLYNSPRAKKVSFYKNRIYLANYTRDGIRFKTSLITSSYPMGIAALVNGDHASHASGTILEITNTKYFYSDTGMNTYEVYRGTTLITTLTVTAVNETSITVTHSGTPTLNSADEIWIAGTFTGQKQYRWPNKQTSSGQSVKQYDTFKLVGGDEDEIKMVVLIGNVMLIANNNAMMTWNDYMLENMDLGVGCVSPRGYVKLMGSCYFLHYSGIYSTTGGIPNLISRKVDKYISGATREGLENASTAFKGLSVFFAIGDVTLYNADGSFWKTLPDVCLEFDVADQSWFVHTNVSSSQFETFVESTGKQRTILLSKKAGKSSKEFLSGDTDDGEIIFFRADTQVIQLSKSFEFYAQPLEIVTEIDRGASVECFIALDESEKFFQVEGTFSKGVSTLKLNSKDGTIVKPTPSRKIKVSFRDSSKQRCKLLQTSVIFIPTEISEPGVNKS